jgi:hypothetical protein
LKPGELSGKDEIEKALETLPDKVADMLIKWRTATLDRERIEALLYLKFKVCDGTRTATEIKAMVNSNGERYKANLDEAVAEAEYTRLYERLLSLKKNASLRTAY